MSDKDQEALGEIEGSLVLPETGLGFRVLIKADFWESQKLIAVDMKREGMSDEWSLMLTRDSAIALAHQLLTVAKA